MERFIYSTALGFVVYQFLAYLRPPNNKNSYRVSIAGVGIIFGKKSAALAQYGVPALWTIAILGLLLLLHNYLVPYSLSRNSVNFVLGIFCGPLLGIWLNSIVRHPPDKGLNKPQIIGGIGLVVLVILGSMGDQGVNLIEQYSKHISSFKAGGVELQFNVTPRAPSAPLIEQPKT